MTRRSRTSIGLFAQASLGSVTWDGSNASSWTSSTLSCASPNPTSSVTMRAFSPSPCRHGHASPRIITATSHRVTGCLHSPPTHIIRNAALSAHITTVSLHFHPARPSRLHLILHHRPLGSRPCPTGRPHHHRHRKNRCMCRRWTYCGRSPYHILCHRPMVDTFLFRRLCAHEYSLSSTRLPFSIRPFAGFDPLSSLP